MQALNDEERQEIVANLRMAKMAAPTFAKEWCLQAADEIERLANKVYELEVELRESVASVDLQRDFVEWEVNELRKQNHWLRAKLSERATCS